MALAGKLYNRLSCVSLAKLSKRNIMLTNINMEEALEKLQKNPYYEKYSSRIASLQQTSPEEFLQRVQRNTATVGPVDTRQYSSVLNPKEKLPEGAGAAEKKLDDILKTELVKGKSPDEIRSIWEEYHKSKEVIAAAIPAEHYTVLQNNMRQHPVFLFPLPREQGYEFMVCQSTSHELHFTPLLAFQVHKENAPECLTVVHYTELAERGLVLMRGEYDKNVLSGKEAQCLANEFQLYYGGADRDKTLLLKSFTENPESFKHMDLIRQLESITLV